MCLLGIGSWNWKCSCAAGDGCVHRRGCRARVSVSPGHARCAALRAARGEHVLRRRQPSRPLVANTVARGQLREDRTSTRGSSTASRPTTFPMPVTARRDGARTGTVQRVLLAVSRPHRRRQRHDRAARLPPAALVPRGSAAQRAGRLLLRRDDAWVRRHAGLRGAAAGRRSLGHRGLHPRAAVQPARHAWTTCRPIAAPISTAGAAAAARRRASRRRRRTDVDAETSTFTPPVADIDARCAQGARSPASSASCCCAIGFVVDRDHFFRSWLIAFLLFLGISLGSMALMMIQHLSGGRGASSAASSRRRAACCRCWRCSSCRSCSGCSRCIRGRTRTSSATTRSCGTRRRT